MNNARMPKGRLLFEETLLEVEMSVSGLVFAGNEDTMHRAMTHPLRAFAECPILAGNEDTMHWAMTHPLRVCTGCPVPAGNEDIMHQAMTHPLSVCTGCLVPTENVAIIKQEVTCLTCVNWVPNIYWERVMTHPLSFFF